MILPALLESPTQYYRGTVKEILEDWSRPEALKLKTSLYDT